MALTQAADVFVSAALTFILRDEQAGGRLFLADPSRPEDDCGVVILALGKHGAGELNYSSDVDLIVFFDPDSRAIPEHVDAAQFFIQITRRLARLLQDRTEDGYVLRVDLRLRPDLLVATAADEFHLLGPAPHVCLVDLQP